ncbi:MAG: hypothetical protein MRZ97_04130, partial [Firmicutes bacterium]|nr:hypothetical protein [Bacillota bacterium]
MCLPALSGQAYPASEKMSAQKDANRLFSVGVKMIVWRPFSFAETLRRASTLLQVSKTHFSRVTA